MNVAPRNIWHAAKNAVTKGDLDTAKEYTKELILISRSDSPAAKVAERYAADMIARLA